LLVAASCDGRLPTLVAIRYISLYKLYYNVSYLVNKLSLSLTLPLSLPLNRLLLFSATKNFAGKSEVVSERYRSAVLHPSPSLRRRSLLFQLGVWGALLAGSGA